MACLFKPISFDKKTHLKHWGSRNPLANGIVLLVLLHCWSRFALALHGQHRLNFCGKRCLLQPWVNCSYGQKNPGTWEPYAETTFDEKTVTIESYKHHNDNNDNHAGNNPSNSDTNKHNNNTIKQHALFESRNFSEGKTLSGILRSYNTPSLIFLLLSPLILPWYFISWGYPSCLFFFCSSSHLCSHCLFPFFSFLIASNLLLSPLLFSPFFLLVSLFLSRGP